MNREQAKEIIPIIQAFADGKTIQSRIVGSDEWYDATDCGFNFLDFEYRVKPDSSYRPYETQEEVIRDLERHKPYNFVRAKHNYYLAAITFVGPTTMFGVNIDGDSYSFEKAFDKFVWPDGSPFGVLKE